MVVAGAAALSRAWHLRVTRNVTRNADDPPAQTSTLRWHRRAGWTAVIGGALGLVGAAFVLGGMYERAAG